MEPQREALVYINMTNDAIKTMAELKFAHVLVLGFRLDWIGPKTG